MAGHEEGMLSGVGADIEKDTLVRIRRCHNVPQEKEHRLFVSPIIKDVLVDIIAGVSLVTDAVKISGEIKIFLAIAR